MGEEKVNPSYEPGGVPVRRCRTLSESCEGPEKTGSLKRAASPARTVSVHPFEPGELDVAILREMYRSGKVTLSGIDPRLNATRVARSLHVGRARVAARLKWWKESGFVRKYAVWLNPALIGWHGAWAGVQVDHHRSKDALFRRLALVDGVVSAMDFVGPWVSVALVAPDPETLQRRLDLIRHLVGVTDIEGPVPWRIAEPKRPLTPLEIRIVRALRAEPAATLSAIARRVGISTRTMTRKYSELVESLAVWFVPILDFTALTHPVVSLNVKVDSDLDRATLSRRIRSRFPLTLDFGSTGIGPDLPPQELQFFVTLPSAASLEELEQFVESIDGVRTIDSYIMIRIYDYPVWFDQHLETISRDLASGSRARGRKSR